MAIENQITQAIGQGLSFDNSGWLIVFIIALILFVIIGLVIGIILTIRLRWPIKITLMQHQGEGYQVVGRDRARYVKIGEGGEQILHLMRKNVFRVGYGKFIAKKTMLFVIGSDGLWYNATFGDFDKRLYEVNFSPVEKDARLSNVNLRKIVERNYKPGDFWNKYGPLMLFGVFFIVMVIIGIMAYFMFDKWNQIATTSNEGIKLATEMQKNTGAMMNETSYLIEKVSQLASELGQIQRGSGLT